MKNRSRFLGILLTTVVLSRGAFTPFQLNTNSFNHDIVVEANAIHARSIGATTASLDAGTNNTGFTLYEQGYNADSAGSGLPAPGSTITSASLGDHSFILAPSYTANNAVLLDTNVTTGTLTLASPVALSSLSFLTASGNGSQTVNIVIHHANGSTESSSFSSPDWFNNPDPAFTAAGRVDAQTGGFDSVDSTNPNLYSADVALTDTTSPVTSIDFANTATGNGHATIFAVSGATTAGGTFDPLTVSGFNEDLIVEAAAQHQITTVEATTASMDAGMANTGFSWYEIGYATNAPNTGLPHAGTTLTNVSASDHIYALSPSWSNGNAALLDSDSSSLTLTPATPQAFSALSFLASSGNGAMTLSYTINHADSTTETGSLVVPDWFGGANPALIASGRVDVQSGGLDNVNNNNPRLYAIDITLTDTTSPITSIDLAVSEGTGHAAILAVSGASGSGAPTVLSQPASTNIFQAGTTQFTVSTSGTLPMTFAWQHAGTNGVFTNITDNANFSGAGTTTLQVNNASFETEGQYRVNVTNSAGSASSLAATLGVLSNGTDITSPGDVVEAFGGTSPDQETVEHAIDNVTAKYLNFGTDGNTDPPFAGPVGFTVTPTLGADASGTVVNALRFYTANDTPARDPIDYLLEGSNDAGGTYSPISAGALNLPDARNNSGLDLDPTAQAVQEVRFSNSTAYKSYRVTFTHVKNDATANSMQIGEVEFLGTASSGAAPHLTIAKSANGELTITSSVAGTLQSTPSLNPPITWTNEGPINGSVTVTPTGTMKFYRVIAQ
jgi:hypothetical protein